MLQQEARRLRDRDRRDPFGAGVPRSRPSSALELDWRKYVEFDPRLMRPAEVDILQGDATKARRVLGLAAPRSASRNWSR